jgi:hypothetical protein
MANTIFFSPKFIRLSGGNFIPGIVCGQKNTRYPDTGKICRDFAVWRAEFLGGGTREKILALLEEERKRSWIGEEFEEATYGWFAALQIGRKSARETSYSDLLKFFEKGFKKALSFEGYFEAGQGGFYLSVYKEGFGQSEKFFFNTEEEFFSLLEENKEAHKIYLCCY